jgi:hypothetical protein
VIFALYLGVPIVFDTQVFDKLIEPYTPPLTDRERHLADAARAAIGDQYITGWAYTEQLCQMDYSAVDTVPPGHRAPGKYNVKRVDQSPLTDRGPPPAAIPGFLTLSEVEGRTGRRSGLIDNSGEKSNVLVANAWLGRPDVRPHIDTVFLNQVTPGWKDFIERIASKDRYGLWSISQLVFKIRKDPDHPWLKEALAFEQRECFGGPCHISVHVRRGTAVGGMYNANDDDQDCWIFGANLARLVRRIYHLLDSTAAHASSTTRSLTPEAERVRSRQQPLTVFLCGDGVSALNVVESRALADLTSDFPVKIVRGAPPPVAWLERNQAARELNPRSTELMQADQDFYIAARAHYFIGTRFSSFSSSIAMTHAHPEWWNCMPSVYDDCPMVSSPYAGAAPAMEWPNPWRGIESLVKRGCWNSQMASTLTKTLLVFNPEYEDLDDVMKWDERVKLRF